MSQKILESHIVPEGIEKIRLRDYIFEIFEILPTKKSVRKAIKKGEILVNGEHRESGLWVQSGQKIELIEPETNINQLYDITINVSYEDDHIAVVEKPPGIPVNGNFHRTLENSLPANLNKSEISDSLKWPCPVHRLDKSTGGLVIIAKTYDSRVKLGWQFQRREVKKRYRAIVMGKLDKKGTFDDPIDNRNALTLFIPLSCTHSIKSEYLTLVDVFPETGRYHQIRRHFSQNGFPLLGDKLYGPPGNILLGKGLFLWAVELQFIHPQKETLLNVKIDEPDKFERIIKREEARWGKYNEPYVSGN